MNLGASGSHLYSWCFTCLSGAVRDYAAGEPPLPLWSYTCGRGRTGILACGAHPNELPQLLEQLPQESPGGFPCYSSANALGDLPLLHCGNVVPKTKKFVNP